MAEGFGDRLRQCDALGLALDHGKSAGEVAVGEAACLAVDATGRDVAGRETAAVDLAKDILDRLDFLVDGFGGSFLGTCTALETGLIGLVYCM